MEENLGTEADTCNKDEREKAREAIGSAFIGKLRDEGIVLSTSETIKVLMNREGIKVQDVAERLGISPQAFNYNLKYGSWKLERLKQIAFILGVNVEVLI